MKVLIVVAFALAGCLVGVDRADAVSAPAALEAVACSTASACVAVGGPQTILVSQNAGRTWTTRANPVGRFLYGVACPTAKRCVAVGDAGTILVSRNRNETWTAVRSGTTEPLAAVACPGDGHCYAVGDAGTVLASDDSGVGWVVAASGTSVIDGVACSTPIHCVAVTSDAEYDLYTQDGTRWNRADVPSEPLLALAPMNSVTCAGTTCLAAGNRGLLARSTDTGRTWTFLFGTVTLQNLDAVACMRPTRCLAVGSNGVVAISANGGRTWLRDWTSTEETLLGMTCVTRDNCLAVGSGRTVVGTHDGGTKWIALGGESHPRIRASVLVVGDSFSHTLALYVGRDAPAYGLAFIDGGLDGCALARGDDLGSGPTGTDATVQAVSGPCAATGSGWPAIYRTDVRLYRPRLSILAVGPWDLSSRLIDGRWLTPGQEAYDAYYRHQMVMAVHILTSRGGRVALATVPSVSTSGSPVCAPGRARVAVCPGETERVEALNSVARQVAAEDPAQVTLIDLGRHLSPGGRYERIVDGVTVRAADGVHLSEAGGEWLIPWLIPRVLAANH